MPSRRIDDLEPVTREKARLCLAYWDSEGIEYVVTGTLRTHEEQMEMWARGRTIPGPQVTWTQHSPHEDGKAFDALALKNGKLVKDGNDPIYQKMGQIAESIGFQWGIMTKAGKHIDLDHFQLKG